MAGRAITAQKDKGRAIAAQMCPALRMAEPMIGAVNRPPATMMRDRSTDAVISSLVLCTVNDPVEVLAEIRRILRPGGTYRFVEHVAAPAGSVTRGLQRALRRPWAWTFEGCSCERDLATLLRATGFARVDVTPYRLHSPFITFNTQIAGVAYA